jgi:anti-anti-sigma factor
MAEPRAAIERPGPGLRVVAGSTGRRRGRSTRPSVDGQSWAVDEVEEPAPRTVLLRLRGSFDEPAALDVTRILDDRLRGFGMTEVVIDLAGVTALASAGLSTLHRLHRLCRTAGLHLVLVGTANPAVHRYLYLSGLLPLVDARPTVEAALRTRPSAGRPARAPERRW